MVIVTVDEAINLTVGATSARRTGRDRLTVLFTGVGVGAGAEGKTDIRLLLVLADVRG